MTEHLEIAKMSNDNQKINAACIENEVRLTLMELITKNVFHYIEEVDMSDLAQECANEICERWCINE
jgi:hypothetical protein